MVHEHPGVYSSYDASSVIGGKKTARILGAVAVSTTGTANEVVTLTSYAEGVSAFGEDAEGTVGMAALLAALYRNGAAVVKAVKVRAAIRSQVMVELENKRAQEIIDSFGEVSVKASEDDPTVCLVEFSFAVAHGLNRIYLSAHITV